MLEEKNKREILKEKVVELVKEFVKTEGGISQDDLRFLFGTPLAPYSEVATALSELAISFNG